MILLNHPQIVALAKLARGVTPSRDDITVMEALFGQCADHLRAFGIPLVPSDQPKQPA